MFNDKKAVDKLEYCKMVYCSASLDNQNERAVNHATPVIDKLSPIALSISLHLHYNVLTSSARVAHW